MTLAALTEGRAAGSVLAAVLRTETPSIEAVPRGDGNGRRADQHTFPGPQDSVSPPAGDGQIATSILRNDDTAVRDCITAKSPAHRLLDSKCQKCVYCDNNRFFLFFFTQ